MMRSSLLDGFCWCFAFSCLIVFYLSSSFFVPLV
jgi:hypothetical protein